MIRVVITGVPSPGIFEWSVNEPGLVLGGRSREPLLDACRALERTGVSTPQQCALFWEGSDQWTLRTPVSLGAGLTVRDPSSGVGGTRFQKFVPYERPGHE